MMSGIEYDADALREIVRAVLEEPDDNAIVFLMSIKGYRWTQISSAIRDIGKAGGDAERFVEELRDPVESRKLWHRAIRQFLKFGETLRDVIPRGLWVTNRKSRFLGYELLEGDEMEKHIAKEREHHEWRERVRISTALTYASVAAHCKIKKSLVRHYVKIGYLEPVYRKGENKAIGVTRESFHLFKKWVGGVRFAEDGTEFARGEYVDRDEATRILDSGFNLVARYANKGDIIRVYDMPHRITKKKCWYSRESVIRLKTELDAGIFYSKDGRILGTERVSACEACGIMGCGRDKLCELANGGMLERVFFNAEMTSPKGFTRESVIAYAQAHPPRLVAKAAVAAPDFMVEVLPPKPRPQRLKAAKLVPTDAPDNHSATPSRTDAQPRRERPRIIFRLISITTKPKEETMEETEKQNPTASDGKLQVAKAFTIHEDGVIRAICVSEEDRDEIAAALKFYRRVKGRESEIESALELMRNVKATLGITAQATAEEVKA